MDPVVRRATLNDTTDLARLQHLARQGIEDVRGGALRLAECPVVTDWNTLINDPHTVVVVGTLDESVMRYAVMQLSAEKNRGLITHAYVEAEARELGLGDTMVEHFIAAVRTAGLDGIEAVALPGDRETKNMFERAGLTARKLTVYKALQSNAD